MIQQRQVVAFEVILLTQQNLCTKGKQTNLFSIQTVKKCKSLHATSCMIILKRQENRKIIDKLPHFIIAKKD